MVGLGPVERHELRVLEADQGGEVEVREIGEPAAVMGCDARGAADDLGLGILAEQPVDRTDGGQLIA